MNINIFFDSNVLFDLYKHKIPFFFPKSETLIYGCLVKETLIKFKYINKIKVFKDKEYLNLLR